MFWRLHKQVIKDAKQQVDDFLTEVGDHVQWVNGPVTTLPPAPGNILQREPSVVISTLQDVRSMVNKMNGIPWSYYHEQRYSVSYWLPRAVSCGVHTLNANGCAWCPAGMLHLRQFDHPLFVKSNVGHKVITGQTITTTSEASLLVKDIPPETMLFVAPALNLSPIEHRFWIVNREVVGSASYSWDEDLDLSNVTPPKEAYNVAQQAAVAPWVPDLAFVVDVVQNDGKFFVNEYNCISTSGFYAGADIRGIFTALRKIAIDEFNGDLYFEEV